MLRPGVALELKSLLQQNGNQLTSLKEGQTMWAWFEWEMTLFTEVSPLGLSI